MISKGADPWAMATPKPRKNRAAMNIWKFTDTLWRTTAKIMIIEPAQIPHRRPRPSAMYGVMGRASNEPRNMMPEKMPLIEPEGSCISETQ